MAPPQARPTAETKSVSGLEALYKPLAIAAINAAALCKKSAVAAKGSK